MAVLTTRENWISDVSGKYRANGSTYIPGVSRTISTTVRKNFDTLLDL